MEKLKLTQKEQVADTVEKAMIRWGSLVDELGITVTAEGVGDIEKSLIAGAQDEEMLVVLNDVYSKVQQLESAEQKTEYILNNKSLCYILASHRETVQHFDVLESLDQKAV